MKKLIILTVISLCSAAMVRAQYADQKEAKAEGNRPLAEFVGQRKVLWNFDWEFSHEIVNGKLSNSKLIDLPHDFQFEQPWTEDGIKARVLDADGMDLCYLNVFAVDSKGRIVPDYDGELSVSVEGVATLLALDNGDHYTNDLFAGIAKKKMRGGKMQIILRSKRESGRVQVNAVSGKFKTTYKANTKTVRFYH